MVVPEPRIATDTEITGSLLRQIREARSIDIITIAQRTKVNASHLRAIEEENWEVMPAQVYLRGFLVEYARFLKLDIGQVTKTFIARYIRSRKQRD